MLYGTGISRAIPIGNLAVDSESAEVILQLIDVQLGLSRLYSYYNVSYTIQITFIIHFMCSYSSFVSAAPVRYRVVVKILARA